MAVKMQSKSPSVVEGPRAVDDPHVLSLKAKLIELAGERKRIQDELAWTPNMEIKDAAARYQDLQNRADAVLVKTPAAERESLTIRYEALKSAIQSTEANLADATLRAGMPIWAASRPEHIEIVRRLQAAAVLVKDILIEEAAFIDRVKVRATAFGKPIAIGEKLYGVGAQVGWLIDAAQAQESMLTKSMTRKSA